jgi:hypothetical protein
VSHRFFPKELVIHHTIHALKRGILRNITEDQVKEIIQTGIRRLEKGKGDRGGDIWLFKKDLGEKEVSVVTEILLPDCYVITVKPS